MAGKVAQRQQDGQPSLGFARQAQPLADQAGAVAQVAGVGQRQVVEERRLAAAGRAQDHQPGMVGQGFVHAEDDFHFPLAEHVLAPGFVAGDTSAQAGQLSVHLVRFDGALLHGVEGDVDLLQVYAHQLARRADALQAEVLGAVYDVGQIGVEGAAGVYGSLLGWWLAMDVYLDVMLSSANNSHNPALDDYLFIEIAHDGGSALQAGGIGCQLLLELLDQPILFRLGQRLACLAHDVQLGQQGVHCLTKLL